jgi:hypothetical protein
MHNTGAQDVLRGVEQELYELDVREEFLGQFLKRERGLLQ